MPAVHDVSLTVQEGEIFALLGPNGAGKTTTVEIRAGSRRADSGRIRVLGVDPSRGDPAWKDRFGIVTQHSNGLKDLTVTEAVRSIAWCYSAPRSVDEVIEAVGLSEKRSARRVKLSGGQRRRLDVALGLVGNPSLLLLDEPTTGFDPEARRAFWGLIRSLSGQGMTILLTSHYLDEAEQLADRVGVIAGGRVLEIKTPDAIGGRDASGPGCSGPRPARPASVSPNSPPRLSGSSACGSAVKCQGCGSSDPASRTSTWR